ncbi:protein translocase SEC61 complex subunit gamma [Candidatus Woesearchaeota archaeon CG10_big_fil_rev_8_21_14_0_10_37_12]|nr:MAG: protein translocase SEC61 complex subunit gamma [Candidatus Woesearchaeota archaeon CG10_big_fil_rev_8_21_14_0_10_37_12]
MAEDKHEQEHNSNKNYEPVLEETQSTEPEIPQAEVPNKLVQQTQRIGSGLREKIPAGWERLKQFSKECLRVLRVTKKPDKEEYKTIVKISAAGMALIGFIGFIVYFIKELLF